MTSCDEASPLKLWHHWSNIPKTPEMTPYPVTLYRHRHCTVLLTFHCWMPTKAAMRSNGKLFPTCRRTIRPPTQPIHAVKYSFKECENRKRYSSGRRSKVVSRNLMSHGIYPQNPSQKLNETSSIIENGSFSRSREQLQQINRRWIANCVTRCYRRHWAKCVDLCCSRRDLSCLADILLKYFNPHFWAYIR